MHSLPPRGHRPAAAFAVSAPRIAAWAVFALLTGLGTMQTGCGSVEKAAAKDPMKCERDPSCGKGRDVYADCTQQCVDDPQCMDRCREMQSDRVGKP